MSDTGTLSAWEQSVKNISDHTSILGENGLVKTWYAFLNAEFEGFSYRIRVRFDPPEQKIAEEYDIADINQSMLQNTETIAKNFDFKYKLYLSNK
jgi:hypothetical protein